MKKVSDCNLAERLIHEELKEFRPQLNREFFRISSTEAVKVVQRIAEKVNRQKPNPVATARNVQDEEPPSPPSPPARLYAVSFNCERCGNYQISTVERYAANAKCPSCQHENNISIGWH
jgi:rubrerythrin